MCGVFDVGIERFWEMWGEVRRAMDTASSAKAVLDPSTSKSAMVTAVEHLPT